MVLLHFFFISNDELVIDFFVFFLSIVLDLYFFKRVDHPLRSVRYKVGKYKLQ